MDVQIIFWTSKTKFGRPTKIFGRPKNSLDVQQFFLTSKQFFEGPQPTQVKRFEEKTKQNVSQILIMEAAVRYRHYRSYSLVVT